MSVITTLTDGTTVKFRDFVLKIVLFKHILYLWYYIYGFYIRF